jgi:hypothetical protein
MPVTIDPNPPNLMDLDSRGRINIHVRGSHPNGVCQLRLTDNMTRLITLSDPFDCERGEVRWDPGVFGYSIAEGFFVFLDPCTTEPSRADNITNCRGRTVGEAPEVARGLPIPVRVIGPAGRLCPSLAGGETCDQDIPCRDELDALEGARAHWGFLCERRRIERETADRLGRMAGVLVVAAAVVGALALAFSASLFLAPAAPFLFGLAVALVAAAILAIFLATTATTRANELEDEIPDAQNDTLSAVNRAVNICTCPGCGVPMELRGPPSQCTG